MTQPYQREFIDLCVRLGVLKFGSFRLKSGRESPYFFNAGLFNTGLAIAAVGRAYAAAIAGSGAGFDMLFGPAYKGIALASATAMALAEAGLDVPFSFNRKEAKDHGEGGMLIGAPLAGRVLIIDDVITDGAAKRESAALIRAQGAEPAGVVIMLDRCERIGPDHDLSAESAVQAFARSTGTPVIAIANLDDLLRFLQSDAPLAAPLRAQVPIMQEYRQRYGA